GLRPALPHPRSGRPGAVRVASTVLASEGPSCDAPMRSGMGFLPSEARPARAVRCLPAVLASEGRHVSWPEPATQTHRAGFFFEGRPVEGVFPGTLRHQKHVISHRTDLPRRDIFIAYRCALIRSADNPTD